MLENSQYSTVEAAASCIIADSKPCSSLQATVGNCRSSTKPPFDKIRDFIERCLMTLGGLRPGVGRGSQNQLMWATFCKGHSSGYSFDAALGVDLGKGWVRTVLVLIASI
jgi:hypothetical protein